jgi:hypothetical protein
MPDPVSFCNVAVHILDRLRDITTGSEHGAQKAAALVSKVPSAALPHAAGDAQSAAPPEIRDAGAPPGAPIWNYRVGGKDNFPADREVAEPAVTACPG